MNKTQEIFLLNWYKDEDLFYSFTSKTSEKGKQENFLQKNLATVEDEVVKINQINSQDKINDVSSLLESIYSFYDPSRSKKNISFFEGDENANILILNDFYHSTSADNFFDPEWEDLLTRMLLAINIDLSVVAKANIFFKNTNQKQNIPDEEIEKYMPYITKLIELINPGIIISLGQIATNAIISENKNIVEARGKIIKYKDKETIIAPILHPKLLIKQPTLKRLMWEDLKKIDKEIIDRKIVEK